MSHTSSCFLFAGLLALGCGRDQNSYTAYTERPAGKAPPGMAWIPGGQYTMGALETDEEARADERPSHRVSVSGFWMDATEVTNTQFRVFVEATGYVTIAEEVPDWEELRKQLPPETPKPADSVFVAASMVFTPVQARNLEDWSQWWSWVPGANWQHPQGPLSTLEGKDNHPVVQVSWIDVMAYLDWAGKRLPSEAELGICGSWWSDGSNIPMGSQR